MINKTLAVAALITALAVNADDNTVVIRGKSSVLPDSTELVLFHMIGSSGKGVAEAYAIDGQFSFEVPVDSGLTQLNLHVNAPGFQPFNRYLYVRPGAVVEVEGNDCYTRVWPVKSEVPEQLQYDAIMNVNRELWEQLILLYIDKPENYVDQAMAIESEIFKREVQYLSGRSLTEFELDHLAQIARGLSYHDNYRDELLALYESLPQADKQSDSGQAIYDYLFPAEQVGVGDTMPDLPMRDLDGNEHHFSELLGKWVLVDFWGAGCGPCIHAIPEMKQVAEKFGDKLETVSLTIDVDRKWREASEEFGITGNNWSDGLGYRGYYQRVDAQGTPTYVVIAPDGTIANEWTGYGSGVILRRVDFILNQERGETKRSEAGGVVTVDYPACVHNNTYTLVIKSVELSDKATVLHFDFYYIPHYWIKIAPEARLVAPDGTEYHIIGSEGIVPGQELFANDEGRGSFSISFEPFKEAVDVFDFYEDHDPNGWQITGIKLNSK